MGMFTGKKGVILGVANDRSIAWAIAHQILLEGGEIGFSHLPDPPGDEKQKNRRRKHYVFRPFNKATYSGKWRIRKADNRLAFQEIPPLVQQIHRGKIGHPVDIHGRLCDSSHEILNQECVFNGEGEVNQVGLSFSNNLRQIIYMA